MATNRTPNRKVKDCKEMPAQVTRSLEEIQEMLERLHATKYDDDVTFDPLKEAKIHDNNSRGWR